MVETGCGVSPSFCGPVAAKNSYGHALMEIAKQQARLARRRALILETQSANANAIGFYLHEAILFRLVWIYAATPTVTSGRKGCPIELGWFPQD